MDITIGVLITVASFIFMEFVAWFTHKYIMHGILWNLHKDHHQPKKGYTFQKNDYFFLIFAAPGIICITIGFSEMSTFFWIGLGITLYGFAYFTIHDIFIHQRFNLFKKTSSTYLKGLRKAHKIHHKNTEKYDGENFGMLFFPFKYWK